MSDDRKDLPPVNSPNFLEKVREALGVYLGNRGDKLDRGVTLRDLTDSGIVTLRPGYANGGGRGLSPIGGVGANVGGEYEADLTPPPTPTGFTASAAISNIFIGHDGPIYTQGHGHSKTVVYGATWVSGALPVFANAVVLTEFSGSVFSHPTNPATTWHLWIKWVTVDGVASTNPAGGTNGLVVTTGQDVGALLTALAGQITQSQLYSALGTRIDLIDGPASLSGSVAFKVAAEALARSNAMTTEALARSNADSAEAGARVASVEAEALARLTGINSEALTRAAALAQEAKERLAAASIELKQRVAADVAGAEDLLRSVLANSATSEAGTLNLAVARSELTQNLVTGLLAEATQRTTLDTKLTTENAQTMALLVNESTARSTADSAQVTARLALAAKLDSDIGATTALISTESAARALASSAEATLRETLAAQVAVNKTTTTALLTQESATRASADAAEATLRGTLAAKLDTDVGGALAAIASEANTRASADAAEAAARNTLSAQILGADGTSLSQGLIYNERTARATATGSLAQQITLLSAGAGEQFDWQTIWYFDSGTENWTGNGAPTATAGWLRPANHATASYAESPGGVAADGSKYGQMRLRIRKVGSPVFAGFLWWRTSTDSTWDAARRVALTVPTFDVNGIGLITASPVWPVTLDRIRLDLSAAQTAADYFELDWVAVGRPSPGASSAQLTLEQTARADADSALTNSVSTLSAQVNNPTNGLPATLALLTTEQATRATADTANASAVSTLSAQVNNPTTGLPAAHAAVVSEQAARVNADAAEATARTTLAARVTSAEGAVATNASAIVTEASTRATADGANATAISVLSSQVNNVTTGLPATLALLTTEQTTRANADTANASATTLLSAQVNNATTGLPATRATLLTEQTTRADADTANANATTALSVQVNNAVTGLPATRADLVVTQNTLASATAASASEFRTLRSQSQEMDEATLLSILSGEAAKEDFKGTLALARQELSTDIVIGISAEAAARLALAAVVNTNAATLTQEQLTRATKDEAIASSVETLSGTVGDNRALLVNSYRTKVDQDSATAQAVTLLESKVGGSLAQALTNYRTLALQDVATAQATTALESKVDGKTATLLNDYYTKTGVDGILAQAKTQLFAVANTGTKTFNQTEAPTRRGVSPTTSLDIPLETGDVWIDTNDNNRPYICTVIQSGYRWDWNARTYAQPEPPVTTLDGAIWIDTNDNNRLNYWSGSAWTSVRDTNPAALITNLEQTKIGYSTKAGKVFDNGGVITDKAGVDAWNLLYPLDLVVWHVGLPLATAVKQVSVTDGLGNTAAIEQAFQTQKTTNDKLLAQYTVKMEVGNLVSGFGLASSPTASEFAIRADRFWLSPPAISSETAPTTNLYVGKAWYQPSSGRTLYMTRYEPDVVTEWKSVQVEGVEQVAAAVSPFVVQASPTVINGVTVPAGVYIRAAYIQNGTITNAKIGNLAVDDAKVANLSVSKLTAGSLAVGQFAQSTSYVSGSSGWRINGDGAAEFSNVTVRGTVYASAGQIGGITIEGSNLRAGQLAYDTGTGFHLGSDGRFSLGNSAGNRLTWDGTNLNVVGTQFSLLDGSATFSGNLNAAGGTFKGILTADAINAVSTINIAGNAVTVIKGATANRWSRVSVSITVSSSDIPAGFTTVPIIVSASLDADGTAGSSGPFNIGRNVTDFTVSGNMIAGFPTANVSAALVVDNQPAGVYTYSFYDHRIPEQISNYYRLISITATLGKR